MRTRLTIWLHSQPIGQSKLMTPMREMQLISSDRVNALSSVLISRDETMIIQFAQG